jgi:hypothetical protein
VAVFVVIVTVVEALHPFEEVAVTEYEPASRPLAVCVVCVGVVLHAYEKPPAPPEPEAVAEPFGASQFVTLFDAEMVTPTAGVFVVTVSEPETVHPLAGSETVTV